VFAVLDGNCQEERSGDQAVTQLDETGRKVYDGSGRLSGKSE
jgi:hypothetical protein